jgi:hypothetical protein
MSTSETPLKTTLLPLGSLMNLPEVVNHGVLMAWAVLEGTSIILKTITVIINNEANEDQNFIFLFIVLYSPWV